MDIELSRAFEAAPQQLWDILLDPRIMARCVPGMESVDIVSDTEYVAHVKVKIAFISARFKVRTVITQMTPPSHLVCEATGEDSSVGSAVKAVSEMTLTPLGDGRTELRVISKANVMGRLGTLGLNPMRTKAERMWEEFAEKVEAALTGTLDAPAPAANDAQKPVPAVARAAAVAPAQLPHLPVEVLERPGLFARIGRKMSNRDDIRVEVRRNDTEVILHWPANNRHECLTWLDRYLGQRG